MHRFNYDERNIKQMKFILKVKVPSELRGRVLHRIQTEEKRSRRIVRIRLIITMPARVLRALNERMRTRSLS